MLLLARAFKPEKVIFAADVDGIFSKDPTDPGSELLPVINEDTMSNIKKSLGKVDDVTGGIFGKLEIMYQIADLGLETLILNGLVENRLHDALMDKDIKCTRVVKRR
jgi:isopentenyl phosphate kinase